MLATWTKPTLLASGRADSVVVKRGKEPTRYRETDGSIWIKGKQGFCQLVAGPDKDGGPMAISTYEQSTGESRTFFSVTEAVKYLRKFGAKPRDISWVRPILYREFKPYSSRFRSGTAGPVSGASSTSVDRTSREPTK